MSIGAYLSTREEHKKNISASLVWFHTFVAFIFFGLLPLLPYILQAHKNIFLLSCIITGSSFVAIGYLKGVMNNRSILRAIIQVVILGGIAASVAYYAGVFLGAL
jgi:VIT1/CCC1 family predicted Fe2+/Mn2+ transporter